MDFAPLEHHLEIAEAVDRVCRGFDDTYWSTCDQEHRFPWEFYRAMAEGGWIGIAIPEQYGGGGQGIAEAALGAQPSRSLGGGDERLVGAAPHDVRAEPGREVRQRAAEGDVPAARRQG